MNLCTDSDRKWGLESESKSKIKRNHPHHKDISNVLNGNTISHCSLQTLLLWTKCPILLKYMNQWTDSARKWDLESESISKIERKLPHNKDISNLLNGNTNCQCSSQTLFLWTKYPILLKYMNQWTDSARKWGLDSESNSKIKENICIIKIYPIYRMLTLIPIAHYKLFSWQQSYPILLKYTNLCTDSGRKWVLESETESKISRKHLYHKDISNLVDVITKLHCSLQTHHLWTKYPIVLKYMNLWTDSDRKWGLESESKSKNKRNHPHHIDISNLVDGITNSHCFLQTLLLWTKYPILIKYMNLCTDSDRKWGLESESNFENWKKSSASYRKILFIEW